MESTGGTAPPTSAPIPTTMLRLRPVAPVFAIALVAACASEAPEAGPAESEETAPPPASVTLDVAVEAGEDGTSDVVATLAATGVRIVPAGDTTSGTGHHHLYLNADLSPIGDPVPSVPGEIVHLGDGSSRYTFEDVPAGEHRMIAVVADGLHVPLDPWVVDTVTFTVR